jgi:hypothetical protein
MSAWSCYRDERGEGSSPRRGLPLQQVMATRTAEVGGDLGVVAVQVSGRGRGGGGGRWRRSAHREIAAHLRSEVDSRNKRGLRLLFFANDTTQAERVEPSWAGARLRFLVRCQFFPHGAVV